MLLPFNMKLRFGLPSLLTFMSQRTPHDRPRVQRTYCTESVATLPASPLIYFGRFALIVVTRPDDRILKNSSS